MNFERARRTAGLWLMFSSLVVGILAAPAAVAAEGDQVPEDREEVEVSRYAYWNADNSKYSNNTATSQFPPEAVCLVQPTACYFPEGDQDPTGEAPTGSLDPFAEEGEETDDGLGALGNSATGEANEQEQELLATMAENDEGVPPADPVPSDSYPVSIAFGEANYRSAIEFDLPTVPEGQQLDSLTMVLTQGDPSYSNESPAFRQAVLAALTCASENEESPFGRCTPEEFEKIPDRELRGDEALQIEACPITGEWEEGTSQDEDDLPEVNCLYTTAGIEVPVDDETTLWVFDLSFMALAWYGGEIEPNGILLRPGAAENFAYGDSETTYSKQVTFQPTVEIAATTSEEPAPPPSLPPVQGTGSGSTGSTDVFAPPPPTSSQPVNMPSGGTSTPPQGSDQAPVVSEPGTEQPAGGEMGEQPATLAAGTPLGEPETPWWLWLLIVPFLGGAWLMSRALEEQAAVATQRSGAMTRLLERQAAQQAPDLVTG